MALINLLPHREEARKKRKQQFLGLLGITALVAAAITFIVGMIIAQFIANQNDRNNLLKAENAKLDIQIKEVASLREEIEGLKARQQAVEDLQSDRNQPVYLLDELAKQTPEGVYLKGIKQEGQRALLTGYAQSNERVSELLRNIGNNSPWLEKPELVEIKAVTVGGNAGSNTNAKDQRRIVEFAMNIDIKRANNMTQARVVGGVDAGLNQVKQASGSAQNGGAETPPSPNAAGAQNSNAVPKK